MKFIAHRINKVEDLKNIPTDCGIEIDLRPWDNFITMEHDPFIKAENFEDLLKEYKHSTLILNIKSERIEFKVLELLKKYNITDYFFLDSSLPMINLLIKQENESNIAIRYSELEPIELLENFKGKVRWVWVDCFNKFILTKEIEEKIHKMGFQICIVSPELQGRPDDLMKHREIIKERNLKIDAVCSKIYNKDLWLN